MLVSLFAAAILATFAMSLILGIQGWGLVASPRVTEEPRLALCGSLIGAGCLGIGLPYVWLGLRALPIGLFFIVPFSACFGAVFLLPGALAADKPHREERRRRFLAACVAIGIALAWAALALEREPGNGDHPVWRAAFAIGCLCLGFGVGGTPSAVQSTADATRGIRIALFSAFYAIAPVIALLGIGKAMGSRLPGMGTIASDPTAIFSVITRGVAVGSIAAFALVGALWLRRMDLEERESEGFENTNEEPADS